FSERPYRSRRVALRRFDLDHIRAEIPKDLCCHRPKKNRRHIDDRYTIKWTLRGCCRLHTASHFASLNIYSDTRILLSMGIFRRMEGSSRRGFKAADQCAYECRARRLSFSAREKDGRSAEWEFGAPEYRAQVDSTSNPPIGARSTSVKRYSA